MRLNFKALLFKDQLPKVLLNHLCDPPRNEGVLRSRSQASHKLNIGVLLSPDA